MDRTEQYRELIKSLLREHASLEERGRLGDSEVQIVEDDKNGHYELWRVGWNGSKRIHFCFLHVDLRDGKFWIQHDGIPDGITPELLEAGVPPEHIVLAFQMPSERKLTPFAVA
jgi:hypothetical protein